MLPATALSNKVPTQPNKMMLFWQTSGLEDAENWLVTDGLSSTQRDLDSTSQRDQMSAYHAKNLAPTLLISRRIAETEL